MRQHEHRKAEYMKQRMQLQAQQMQAILGVSVQELLFV